MKLIFLDKAWENYLSWQKEDKAILRKINDLIKDIKRHPFSGIGKPEPLRHDLSGLWSRRINQAHRLVYKVESEELIIVSCRYHYN